MTYLKNQTWGPIGLTTVGMMVPVKGCTESKAVPLKMHKREEEDVTEQKGSRPQRWREALQVISPGFSSVEIYSSEGEHYSHSVCENGGKTSLLSWLVLLRLMRLKNKNTQCEYDWFDRRFFLKQSHYLKCSQCHTCMMAVIIVKLVS